MREEAIEFSDPLASVRAPIQQELKIAERVAEYNACNMDEVARIDEREEERRKEKAYHRCICEHCADVSKVSSSNGNNTS